MITKYFEEKLGIKTVPEVTDERWRMWDDGGVECEVGEFFYGLVRMSKPETVLETGLYHGISASYIAQALHDNSHGKLVSIEYERQHIETSKKRLITLGLNDRVLIHHVSSLDFAPSYKFDIMLLDTEPQIRFQELVKFYPFLEDGGYVFIHDAPRNLCQGNVNPDHPEISSWPFGDVPEEMKKLNLVKFHFGTPRGLAGFYKPHPDDYGTSTNN